jgi:hypothetical protein
VVKGNPGMDIKELENTSIKHDFIGKKCAAAI